MKGIYLTEEGKKEIIAKIAELKSQHYKDNDLNWALEGHIFGLKEILSSATILPVKESWDNTIDIVTTDVLEKYPSGVIIQSKQ